MNTQFGLRLTKTFLWRKIMNAKSIKTLSVISLRAIYCLMILSMLLSSVGVRTVSAASTYTISGNVGVAGATVTYSGSGAGPTTSDASGNYSLTVNQWSSGSVTPSKGGYTFSPSSRTYYLVNSNQTNQNYTATAVTYTISGSTGAAGGGATITYTGGSTTANASTGNYSFTVAYGWSGTVTPSKTGYVFSPASRSYTNVAANQTNQNYTATLAGWTISGNAGVGGATITYSGGSTTSNASTGDYSFMVSPGWSGMVTPSKTGFSFYPANITYSNVISNQTSQNYTARPTAFTFGSMADSHAADYFSYPANQLSTLNPALVIFSGDIEDNGFTATEMNSIVNILKSENLYNKTFMVRGNHDDHVSGSAALWESYFETAPNIKVMPTYAINKVSLDSSSDQLNYSFDYGNSIFIGLDVPGDIYLLTQAEVDFLDARLTYAESVGLTHAFIYFHGPEYCMEANHCTCSARDNSACTPPSLISVINNHPIVSATFHGHEHVLAWTHMDNTRVSGLTRSYEQFDTSPSGASSYSQTIFPDRVDYAYTDMAEDDLGFATISVNGLSFTVNFYKYGTTQPVWSHTFSKINTPPTISDITDKTTNEDTATGAIPFTVGDAELDPAYLTVTATSSDLALVPVENISLGGSGVNRTIDILPAPNRSGTATITVSVNDGNVTVNDTFLLTVAAVNDAPVADAQSLSMLWNTSINITLTGTDVDGNPLIYSIVSNPAHGDLSGSGANQIYTPVANYSGPDSFTFKANDGNLDSAPATVSIDVTAHTISGNAGVAGATLSYIVDTPKTATADSVGAYSFQVPTNWSGTVTPSKPGYTFSPESMTYTSVLADQPGQNYTAAGITLTISGNAGIAGATLSYTDGIPKTATADANGLYSFQVSYNWSGTVTPSLSGYGFRPAMRAYANVTVNQDSQDYTTTTARVWYVDKTNPNCTDSGQVGSLAIPFCTISRGAYLAMPGQIVQVLHGTYAETIYPERSGTEGNPITYWADPGVTVTGQPGTPTTSYYAFGLGARNYIVIDGFNITNTSNKGIYVDASQHVTITNNHVSNAGATSQNHPYEQGIYLRNTTYSTISGNTTDHNTCIGIRVVGGDHNLISNNISTENFSLIETDAAGIELTGSSYNTVINNIVYSNEDSGINLYYWDSNALGSTHNLVIGNLSYENGDHGIDNYQSPYNTIVGNTVQGNGTVGINFEGNTAALGSFGAIVANNIISENGTTPPSGSYGGNVRFDAYSTTGSTTDYNLFYRTDATSQIIWNNVIYTSLAAFKAAVSGQEVHGLEGNPLFVDPATPVRRQTGVPYDGLGIFGNYYLNPGSPAIDSANADAPGETLADIQGNPRIDDPATPNTGAGARTYDDRGAYEYLPSTTSLPTVTTQEVTDITTTTATGNGNITAPGIPSPTQHGVVWSTSVNPTTADSKTTDGPVSGAGAFTSSITGLTPGTLYHVRAYATNDVGTAYGEDVAFATLLLPTITTQAVTNITATTATGNGNITALGVPNPTQHGVAWSTSANPTTADNKTTDGAVGATGAFTSNMTGLTPGTLYHVRAYATNAAGTVYGDDVAFTSLILPTVTTQAVTSIGTTTATGNGSVTSLGIPNPTQHGVVWSTNANPTTADGKTTDGPVSTTGAFTSNITGLTPGTLYHVRAYAANTAGTAYGEDVTFTTFQAPTVTTQAATDITTTAATGHGNITVLGSSNPTEHGVVWSTSANPTTADSKTTDGPVSVTGPFTSNITGLTPGTLYHVRAYAINAAGTSYGEDVTFTTLIAPTVTTQAVTDIIQTTATGNGNVTSLGVPNPTQHGVVWSVNVNPTIADSKTTDGPVGATGAFTSSITGLALGMQYHVRAYATNSVGTVYGDDVTFTTLPSATSTTTPATNARTGADASGTGTVAWLNPGYITAVDTNYATTTLSNQTSHYLEGSNYGFAIPSNATINGIVVTIGRFESAIGTGNDVRDSIVSLMKAGVVTGSNKAATSTEWPTGSPAAAVYGTTGDLWGTTWTPADINASGFGVALSANSANTRMAYVDYMQISVTYTVTTVSSTTTVNCGGGTPITTYGSSITCVATVVRGSGSYTPSGNVSWTTSGLGSFVTSPCTLSGSSGTATCSVTYTPASVGTGSHLITANYAGDENFLASNGSQTVTVNKKDASVTPNALSKTYGDADPALTGALSGFLPADNVTATYSRISGETVAGSPYVISATLSPVGALVNYNITYNTANFTINKKAATVTLNAASKTYGDADPTLTGILSGFLPADNVTATYSRAPGETVAGSPYAIGATLSPTGVLGNYDITTVPANFTINKKAATVTLNAANKTYGDPDPALTGALSGFLSADNVTAAYSRATGETVAGSPYAISATLSPTDVLGNYDITTAPANFTINRKDASATPNDASKELGQADPVLTGTLVGFLSADAVTATYSRVAGETVEGSPYTISAVLSPAGVLGNYNITYNTANFTILPPAETYTLTVNKIGNGTVTKNPDQATYNYGDVVHLTATADPGWTFFNWSANVVNGTVTITSNTIVTAMFTEDEYNLLIIKSGSGSVTKNPDKPTYHYGDVVTLTPIPDPGWSFDSWSANVVSGQVTIQGNTSVVANFTQDEYTLTIDKVGNGTVTKNPDQATYHYGDVVTLTATPDLGWTLGSWSSNATGGTVTIQGNTTVTATFVLANYTLTIHKVGNGSVTKAPDQDTYHYGDIVALTAIPDPGWSFDSWSANVIDGNVTIQGDTTATVLFAQDEYTLTIDKVGNGTVAKAPDQATYHYGDVVALTATADPGWSFADWSANVVGDNITIQGNTTVTATFTQDEYTLTINKVGNGTVTKAPDQATYHYGDVVALTATADPGWSFANWSANVVGDNITIQSNTTVTATFKELALPTVTTQAVTNISATTATGNGNVVNLGVPNPAEHGVAWSVNPNPTTADSKTTDGPVSATGAFTSGMTGLTPGTLYHVRAYATNEVGTAYGEDVAFTALIEPAVTTQAVTDITTTTATGNGNVTALGVPNPSEHGVVWSINANPTIADSKTTDGPVSAAGAFASNITGLTAGTLYHVRAYATNDAGTSYGEDVTFTTLFAPTVTTQAVTSITATTATGNGNITVLGSPNPTQHGVVWSTSPNPTLSDSKTTDGPVSAAGAFTSSITGLMPGTLYHVRAYATNAVGTAYGDDVTFSTLLLPTVTTQAVTNITTTTATGNGNITSLGIPNPTQYGMTWDTLPNPTIALTTKTAQGVPSGTGAFTSNITGLTPGTLYHVRAYVTNAAGTAYGDDVTFTAYIAPTVTTQAVTNITATTATGNGNVTSLGVPNPTQHGVVWDTSANPTITLPTKTTDGPVNTTGAFTSVISGLTPGTLYHVRAYATNAVNTVYGTDVTFTALSATQEIFTTSGTWIAPAGVTSVTVEVWGGGGKGGSVTSTTYSEVATGGGGGGAYSNATIAVTPGNSYPYVVGSGSTGTGAGGDSYFNNTSTVLAKGGNSVANNSGTGANGGASGSGVGTTKYSGGNGANGNSSVNYGGGGGSSAGTALNGTNATNATGATAPSGGGNGGNGKSSPSGNGSAGSTPGGAGGGAYRSSGTTTYAGGNGANGQIRITYFVDIKATTTTVDCGGGTPVVVYGSSITCVATVATVSGTNSPTGTVSWTTSGAGSFVTSPCTLSGSGGTSTCSVTYTPASVGTGSHLITANYAGTTNFLASSGSQTVTVNKRDASVTPNALSKTYSDADPALTGTLSGFLPADNVTATYSRAIGETVAGSPYAISATLSPVGVLVNYNITYNTTNFTINKKAATVTLDAASKTYGDVDPALSGLLSGFLVADNVTATYSRAMGETVAGSPYAIGATLSPTGVLGNYDITTVPANFTINKKDASVTPNNASKEFGQVDPVLTGTLIGFLPADDVTATYSRVAGETVEGSPYTISATLSPVEVLGNYNITYSTADFTITPAPEEYTLTIEKIGNGTVTKSPDKSTYRYGDVVTLTATPDPGWSFGSWSANATDGSVTIQGNITVTATFTQDEYTLLIIKSGSGSVTKSPDQSTYHYGDVVTLTATPDPGWSFDSWSANAAGGTVTIQGNTSVVATFTWDEYTLTIEKVGNGTVTKSPDQATYHYGDVVALTATPDSGWSFDSWSANATGGSVTIQGNAIVTATFTQNAHPTHVVADFNGDGKTDLSVYKVEPWAGMWYLKDMSAVAYGNSESIPVSCDYNGDGVMDIAVYNAGTWYVKDQFVDNWGDANSIPVPGDYNGDGKNELAVYKVEPWAGMWYIKDMSAVAYGNSESIPVPGDYNGDGVMDIAVYNAGTWYVKDQFVDNWGDGLSFPAPVRDTNGDRDPYQ